MKDPLILNTESVEFPPTDYALDEPNGLLAIGGNLDSHTLYCAYSQGIFPWYNTDEPILWWSPSPRMVLRVEEFHPNHNLKKRLRKIQRDGRTQIRVDTACAEVIKACAQPRHQFAGTWINPAMQHAYQKWHENGYVHSIETWIDNELVGGLYGVSIGHMFFGESMFSFATDASKVALAYLVAFLNRHGGPMIDCQQQTQHLASMGARPIERSLFNQQIKTLCKLPTLPWESGQLLISGEIINDE